VLVNKAADDFNTAAQDTMKAAQTIILPVVDGIGSIFASADKPQASDEQDGGHSVGHISMETGSTDNAAYSGEIKSTAEVLKENNINDADAKSIATRLDKEVAGFIAQRDGRVTKAEIEAFVRTKLEDAQFVDPTAFMTASLDVVAVSYAEVAAEALPVAARACVMHPLCLAALTVATIAAAGYAFYQSHKTGDNSESLPIHEDEGLILTTPANDQNKPDVEIFPSDNAKPLQLPGFSAPEHESDDEGFDIYTGDDMNVLYKDDVNDFGGRFKEEPDHKKKFNAIRKEILKGQAPKSIRRIDFQNLAPGEIPHIHFEDGSALNIDGSDKEKKPVRLNNKEKEWLKKHGWEIPE
jgi:hypothetical protein